MRSPRMHRGPPPSGRVAPPGSEAKFSRFSPGPSVASGLGRKGGGAFWPAVVQKDGGEGGEEGEGSRFVCSCKLGLYGFE